MFEPVNARDDEAEALARALFAKNFSGKVDDVAIGDALRASLMDLVSYVARELGGNVADLDWVEGEGFPGYPYTNEAMIRVYDAAS